MGSWLQAFSLYFCVSVGNRVLIFFSPLYLKISIGRLHLAKKFCKKDICKFSVILYRNMWEVWSVMLRQALHGVLVGHRATEGYRSDLRFPCWGALSEWRCNVQHIVNHVDKYRGKSLKLSCVWFSQSLTLVERTQMKEVKRSVSEACTDFRPTPKERFHSEVTILIFFLVQMNHTALTTASPEFFPDVNALPSHVVQCWFLPQTG